MRVKSGGASVPPPSVSLRGVKLEKEQVTLLIPLYAKAADFRSPNSVLKDAKADELVRAIQSDVDWPRGRGPGTLLAVRSRQFDEWTREFLRGFPQATVLNLGCGLDSRILRVDPPARIDWIDLDFPAVIELRRQFYPSRDGYSMRGESLTDPSWIGSLRPDRPVLVIADGVLEYLSKTEVQGLIQRVTGRADHGEFVFDVMSSKALRYGNNAFSQRTGAVLRWSVNDVTELDGMDSRWKRRDLLPALRSPYFPPGSGLVYSFARSLPSMRDLMRFARYDF